MGIILKRDSVMDILLLAEIIKEEMKNKNISLEKVDENIVQEKYDSLTESLEKQIKG